MDCKKHNWCQDVPAAPLRRWLEVWGFITSCCYSEYPGDDTAVYSEYPGDDTAVYSEYPGDDTAVYSEYPGDDTAV